MTRFFRITLAIAVVVTLFFALSPKAPTLLHSDKSQHELAFAVLAVLASLAYPAMPAVTLFAVLVAFGGAIELLQMIPALHRDAEWWDWAADVAAIAATMAALAVIRALRRRGDQPSVAK